MRKGFTDIVVLLDKSASMSGLTASTIQGYNEFLKANQMADGEANITLVQFEAQGMAKTIYSETPIKHAKALTEETYRADGSSTAYLDELGKLINSTGERYRLMRESQRPEKVIFVVITDGQDNASREFSREAVKKLVEHQEDKYNWEIVFLGANLDAVSVGAAMGVKMSKSMTYSPTAVGTANMFESLTNNSVSYRSGVARDMSFNDEDRKKAAQTSTGA